jgi:3-oxoacyl-[acyl-carrier protein] reductase
MVVMVTGGGSGIGREVALQLGVDGASVAVVDVTQEAGEETVRSINHHNGTAAAIRCDVGCSEAVNEAVAQIERDLGKLTGQVNCAAIWKTSPLLAVAESDWNEVMRVNASGTFFCVQAAGKVMLPRGCGAIVNISSAVGARTPRPLHVHYGASKAAVISITRSAAAAFGPHGVRVNAVCPGAIDTPMFERVKAQPKDVISPLLARISLGRVGHPNEVAQVVTFLLSDRASYVNGQCINVCGGLEMS